MLWAECSYITIISQGPRKCCMFCIQIQGWLAGSFVWNFKHFWTWNEQYRKIRYSVKYCWIFKRKVCIQSDRKKFQAVLGTSSQRIMGPKLLLCQLGKIGVNYTSYDGFPNRYFSQAVLGYQFRIQGRLGLSRHGTLPTYPTTWRKL